MKINFKKYISLLLCLLFIISLSGCAKKDEKRYQSYVKSLIAINYLGATDDYIKATGANKQDAIALYDANIRILTDNLLRYYDITLTEDSDLRKEYEELAKNIYSKVNYKVSNAYKVNDVYKVDVEISPINILAQTKEDVIKHIDDFNQKVANGDFNDYTVDSYNDAFSEGILEILNKGCEDIQYADPVTVTVVIITNDKSYYISDEDFLSIDAAMIAIPEVSMSTSTDTK